MTNSEKCSPRRKKFDSRSSWLVIYSDLSTTLMFMFLLLFSITRMEKKERAGFSNATRNIASKSPGLFSSLKDSGFIESLPAKTFSGEAAADPAPPPAVSYDSYKMKIEIFPQAFSGNTLNEEGRESLSGVITVFSESASYEYMLGPALEKERESNIRNIARLRSVREFLSEKGIRKDSVFYRTFPDSSEGVVEIRIVRK